MTSDFYGRAWHSELNFMMDPITRPEAVRRFKAGKWFTAAVGEGLLVDFEQARTAQRNHQPRPVPEFTLSFFRHKKKFYSKGKLSVISTFYTQGGSIGAIYDWRQEKDRLFLHTVYIYLYPDENNNYAQNEFDQLTYIMFTPEGFSTQTTRHKGSDIQEVVKRCEVPLDGHYEAIPEFGDWAALGNLNRKNR